MGPENKARLGCCPALACRGPKQGRSNQPQEPQCTQLKDRAEAHPAKFYWQVREYRHMQQWAQACHSIDALPMSVPFS
jgi:hypothetical protein